MKSHTQKIIIWIAVITLLAGSLAPVIGILLPEEAPKQWDQLSDSWITLSGASSTWVLQSSWALISTGKIIKESVPPIKKPIEKKPGLKTHEIKIWTISGESTLKK